MEKKKSGFEEIEKMLQEIGNKIEVLIEKGTKATGEASDEIEKKIKELHKNKEKLEKELKEKKAKFEEQYKGKKGNARPFFEESLLHFKQSVRSLISAINELMK
ncbi:hypothetical protein SAMN04488057_11371 [Cyclobacterium lianum]|uniref:Uncharacterized protein n=1 Tax=Cyclobacterium lianum TaxID=388280 RepID=A0A1M7Q2W2_9BACT|nr:hypothetical protein [Cyclobacterium lianum]SHN24490.1 hypothetical protein SAMN04488057_11371 [Cyclobacterium lianum]